MACGRGAAAGVCPTRGSPLVPRGGRALPALVGAAAGGKRGAEVRTCWFLERAWFLRADPGWGMRVARSQAAAAPGSRPRGPGGIAPPGEALGTSVGSWMPVSTNMSPQFPQDLESPGWVGRTEALRPKAAGHSRVPSDGIWGLLGSIAIPRKRRLGGPFQGLVPPPATLTDSGPV